MADQETLSSGVYSKCVQEMKFFPDAVKLCEDSVIPGAMPFLPVSIIRGGKW